MLDNMRFSHVDHIPCPFHALKAVDVYTKKTKSGDRVD